MQRNVFGTPIACSAATFIVSITRKGIRWLLIPNFEQVREIFAFSAREISLVLVLRGLLRRGGYAASTSNVPGNSTIPKPDDAACVHIITIEQVLFGALEQVLLRVQWEGKGL